jgi:diaminopimelate epimerase
MNFYKYHGTGNDFIIIEAMEGRSFLAPDMIASLCRRNTGVGADGIIYACRATSGVDAAMRIFNADGSEAEMCGNGIRCLSKYLYEKLGICKDNMQIETQAGVKNLTLRIEGGLVTDVEVDMGLPDFANPDLPVNQAGSGPGQVSLDLDNGENIEATCVSMGNPHCVIFVDDITTATVSGLGPMLERHKSFPSRTNVEFVQPLDPGHLKVRVWERGVGETAACGSGACAAFVAAIHAGIGESPMIINLPGGDLRLNVDQYGHIIMAGPAVEVFSGELSKCWYGSTK